jgi:predicted nuclease with TOPRIM domain
MAPGFTIAEVRFRGNNMPDAVVTFAPGLSVVAGPSNTGKSLIHAAINFVFGSRAPMTTVDEAAGYGAVFVQVRTADGNPVTFERLWGGGDIRQYNVAANAINTTTTPVVLSAKHSADNQDNISAVLLSLAGLKGVKLRKKQTGDLRNLSFRDFVEYVLISEERIITTLSPIHTGSPIDKTFESFLFRVLLTGQDDAGLIVAPAAKDERAQIAGQKETIERIRVDLRSRIPQDGRTEEDLVTLVASLDARIAEQSQLLQNYRADLAALEQQRRVLEQAHEQSLTRLIQVDANLRRFAMLNEQYISDLKRLQSTVEAGNLFADHQEGPCPICGADPQHHQQHGITPEQLENFTAACQAEAEKIKARRADLAETINNLAAERDALRTTLDQLGMDRAQTAQAFKDILGPSITSTDGTLAGLSEQRSEIAGVLSLYEQLHRLDAIEQVVLAPTTPKTKGENAFATLPPNAYEQFATTVENILREWSFPELDRVVFDTKSEDIVISGKARKDNGKGYRAITYAAFMVGVLQETNRKNLPHPGFLLMDSPLVTYREPDEHIGEGVKDAFYRNLSTTLGDTQVIILENEEPPAAIKGQLAFTGFTKNRTVGRYGLFPPLPDE